MLCSNMLLLLLFSRNDALFGGLLARCDFVVNALPLNASTAGLLDAMFFGRLRKGAVLINLGRGAHINDQDMLAALVRAIDILSSLAPPTVSARCHSSAGAASFWEEGRWGGPNRDVEQRALFRSRLPIKKI